MTKQQTKAERLAEIDKIVANFRSTLTELEACTSQDVILAWTDLGLGVRLFAHEKPFAIGVLQASALAPEQIAKPPYVRNGHGSVARPITRAAAAFATAPQFRTSIAVLLNARAQIEAEAD